MSDTSIENGDVVTFTFTNSAPITGIVDYMPCATGDCWHVIQGKDAWANAKVIYIQNFETVSKEIPK